MRTMLIAMLMFGLMLGSTSEARPPDSMLEIKPLYGLPFNRPPHYRRGPRPPAIREHERYWRPGKVKVRRPFEREGYLRLPRRTPPRANGR